MAEKTKKKRKSYKRRMVSAGIALFFFAALFVLIVVYFFGASYPRFSSLTREEAGIPALKEGMSPQGLTALPETCTDADGNSHTTGYAFAVSGYMDDGAPSRIYLTGKTEAGATATEEEITDGAPAEETPSEGDDAPEGGNEPAPAAEKYVTVQDKDGTALTSHFGGVACTGNYLVICNDKTIVRVRLSDVLAAENGAAVTVVDSLETGLQNSYVSYCINPQTGEGYLYVGEFYRSGNYETDASHHNEVNGEKNYAYIYAYGVTEKYECGVSSVVPEFAYSVRGLVQGVAVTLHHVYLSASYGLPDSKLYVYTNVYLQGGTPVQNIKVGNAEVPLYRLDSSALEDTVKMPCMSEELCVKDGRLYVLFESMSKKYINFVRTRIDKIYSMELFDK